MLYLFNLSLSASSIGLALLAIFISITSIIFLTRYYLKLKKDHDTNVFSMRDSFLSFGLLTALSILLIAFSWTSSEQDIFLPEDDLQVIDDFEILPPRTADRPPPPPPLPPTPKIVEISNDEIIEDQPSFIDESINAENIIDNDIRDNIIKETIHPKIKKEEEIDLPFRIVEDMPRFPGCENNGSKKEKVRCSTKELLSFIYSNVKYPSIARENGIEGTAVIRFVVEKDGSVSNVKIACDIGAGCGAEANRVVTLMQKQNIKWIPGKQRGKAVRVMFTLPIKFKLE